MVAAKARFREDGTRAAQFRRVRFEGADRSCGVANGSEAEVPGGLRTTYAVS